MIARTIDVIMLVVVAILFVFAVRPGSLASLAFPAILASLVLLPVMLSSAIVLTIIAYARGNLAKQTLQQFCRILRWRHGVILLAFTIVLSLGLPTQCGLRFMEEKIEAMLDDAPLRPTPPRARIPLFRFDSFARDERGGVYLRSASAPDGLGPDTMSWGLAFNPNDEGSPFGNDDHEVTHLYGNWHSFRASDDW